MIGFEDIVFENRNKEYGAYDLRKRYPINLLRGLIIGILIVVVPILYLFVNSLFSSFSDIKVIEFENQNLIEVSNLPPLPMPQDNHPKLKDKSHVETPPVIDQQESEPPQKTDVAPNSKTDSASLAALNGSDEGKDSVFAATDVELIPQFIGGEGEFRKFLITNFVWPKIGRSIQGKVQVEFQVSKLGEIRFVHILSGLTPEVDREIGRVFSLCPKWKPACRRGRPVDITFSVTLYLKNY